MGTGECLRILKMALKLRRDANVELCDLNVMKVNKRHKLGLVVKITDGSMVCVLCRKQKKLSEC